MTFNIGLKIKQKRKEYNLTQEEVADKLGVSRQTVSKWENDRSLPDIHSMLLFCEMFDTSLDELLREDSNNNGKVVAELKKKLDIQKKVIYFLSCATVAGGLLLVSQQSKHDNLVAARKEERIESMVSIEVHEKNGERVLSGELNDVKNLLDFDEVQSEALALIKEKIDFGLIN